MPKVKTWYHGTNSEFIDSIEKQGLRRPYLTDVLEIAEQYAEATSGDGDPTVIELSSVDESKFVVDMASLSEPVGYGKITGKQMDRMVAGLFKKYDYRDLDWRKAFKITRTVLYNGVVHPDLILSVMGIQ